MQSGVDPSIQERRYLPIVKLLAEDVTRKLSLEIDPEILIRRGSTGLQEAIASFQRGRGIAFRTFAHYRILAAIFDFLRTVQWPSPEFETAFLAGNKAAEIMEWYSQSAESRIKRTLEAEQQEFKQLLKILMGVVLLSMRTLNERTRSHMERRLQSLDEKERLILSSIPERTTLNEIATQLGISRQSAHRLQFRTLEKFASA